MKYLSAYITYMTPVLNRILEDTSYVFKHHQASINQLT